MRHFSKIIAIVLVMAGGGCKHTLEDGGPYDSVAVYDYSLAVVTSWELLDTTMRWEEQNRTALSIYPEIGVTLDRIREHAPPAHLRAIRLVELYEASQRDDDRTAAERAVVALRGLATEALSLMTEYGL